MIFLCMYDEFGPGMGLPSMKESFQPEGYSGQEMIIRYLRQEGEDNMACPGVLTDIFTGERIPGEMTHKADGVYSWTSSLAYYVEKYNLRLPEHFEQHVRKRMAA